MTFEAYARDWLERQNFIHPSMPITSSGLFSLQKPGSK